MIKYFQRTLIAWIETKNGDLSIIFVTSIITNQRLHHYVVTIIIFGTSIITNQQLCGHHHHYMTYRRMQS